MQGDFKSLAKAASGFEYRAERPNAETFVQQKWGYSAFLPGALAGCNCCWQQTASDAISTFHLHAMCLIFRYLPCAVLSQAIGWSWSSTRERVAAMAAAPSWSGSLT